MRKKLLFLMLIVGIMGLCLPVTAWAGANMLYNPGFEIDDGSGAPDNWGEWSSGWSGWGSGTCDYFEDSGVARTGSWYGQTTCPSSGDWAGLYEYSDLTSTAVEEGTEYYFGAWIKDIHPDGSPGDPFIELACHSGTPRTNDTRIPWPENPEEDYLRNMHYEAIPYDGQWYYVETSYVIPADKGVLYVQFAVGNGGESTHIFDDCYFGLTSNLMPVAVNVYPLNGAQYVPPSAVIEWDRPEDADPNAYDVYLTTDPNANKPEYLVVDGKLQTTYDPPGDLGFNTTYYWRVDLYDPNCTQFCHWPNEGAVWSFTTMPKEPVFTTDAEHVVVAEGDSAVFSVVSPNATLGFQWYKGAAVPVNDGDDGGDVSVVSDATSSTLTIDNVNQAADEDFYYCVATNSYDTTESAHAKLAIAELLAHWTMDSPLVANQYKDETGNHNADPNKPSAVSFTAGIIGGAQGAVQMNNFRWANAGNWRPNQYGGQMTVGAWIKVPDTNDITGNGQGIVSKRVGDEFDWALYVRGGDGSHPDEHYVRFGSWNGGDCWATIDDIGEEWAYVVATVDGDGAGHLYVNGVEQAVDDEWVYGTNEDADILIGKGNPEQYVFPGLIDDVKIYNYARDPYVIATDYTDVAGGSVCVQHRPGDYNGDCKVNLADIAELALIWRNCNIIPASACP